MYALLRRAFDEASGLLKDALAEAERGDLDGLRFVCRLNLGFLFAERGHFEAALQHRLEAVRIARATGSATPAARSTSAVPAPDRRTIARALGPDAVAGATMTGAGSATTSAS